MSIRASDALSLGAELGELPFQITQITSHAEPPSKCQAVSAQSCFDLDLEDNQQTGHAGHGSGGHLSVRAIPRMASVQRVRMSCGQVGATQRAAGSGVRGGVRHHR